MSLYCTHCRLHSSCNDWSSCSYASATVLPPTSFSYIFKISLGSLYLQEATCFL